MKTTLHVTEDNVAQDASVMENPVGLAGMDFIEFTGPNPGSLRALFSQFGFKEVGQHKKKNVSLFRQGGVNFILNNEPSSFAEEFKGAHGPSICATGFRVKDAKKAQEVAISRGARKCEADSSHSFPAVYGIGESVIYFVDSYDHGAHYGHDFDLRSDSEHEGFGLKVIDHLTNNVAAGEMQKWCDFYRDVFNFREVRFFDIQGKETGLISKVMKSPCNQIVIPINEPKDTKSQIQEYLDEYHGAGIQHLALTTNDICDSVKKLRKSGIEFLATPGTYYDALPKRMPNVIEDLDLLRELGVLADGDESGYLLQIFTKNLVGPIFVEIIQRKKHDGFGEGNFQALFDSIEEDQRRRGYLQ